ncbi:MAG TPA: aminotransferase class III-fold pyridoxal phosphate-dependent enzyme, partial [Chlamydiales bacterium]|nr:aminotransferase class III-fold pyridoxal phosphate-dependent enzyme [Chlamydiales bacterium]
SSFLPLLPLPKQAKTLEHVIFAGFTHDQALLLSLKLTQFLPGNMSKIFYSDNGSTAVEVALKIAIQYWQNKNMPKSKVVGFQGAYHGDTFGAMSAAGKTRFTKPFWNYLFPVESIPLPLKGFEERSIAAFLALAKKGDVACFIFEPLIQCAGGMRIYSAQALDRLLEICCAYEIIAIADEVATGFGRTGPLFAGEHLQHSADITCLSKGITGGFVPLGATACQEHIYEAFLSHDPTTIFLHGHSYTGNPIACAAGLASFELTLASGSQRAWIEAEHHKFCHKWKGHPSLKRSQVLGTILVLECKMSAPDYEYFLSHHIVIRPLGDVVYVLPPYCISQEELNLIYNVLETFLCKNY